MLEAKGSDLRRAPSATCQLRRRAPARFSASTASWAAASWNWRARCSASSSRDAARWRSTARPCALTAPPRAGAPASPSCRKAAARCSSPRADLQEHLDRDPRAHLAALAEARRERAIAAHAHRAPRHPAAECRRAARQPFRRQPAEGGAGKWLTHAPKVLILSEPTRGMDVGAKEDVVQIVRGSARRRASASSSSRPSPRRSSRLPTASW